MSPGDFDVVVFKVIFTFVIITIPDGTGCNMFTNH